MSGGSTEAVPGTPAGTGGTKASGRPRCEGGKFLTFSLAGEEYGVEILKVQEIVGMMDITPVPRIPPFILGLMNLRGKVIPVVDLRWKLGMGAAPCTDGSCIIVVRTEGMVMGVVVDSVSEVLTIAPEAIEAAPSFGTDVNTDYILGIGKTGGGVRILLDIERVLSSREALATRAAALEGKKTENSDGGC